MAGAVRPASVVLLSVHLLLLVAPVAICLGSTTSGETGGFRAALIRTAESRNLSLAADRSRRRLSMYTSGTRAQAPVRRNREAADYIMQFRIGDPAVLVWAEADTGSDLVWVKCSPCKGCDPVPSPLYDPSQPSFTKLPCTSGLCQALGEFRKCTTNSNDCSYHYVYGISGDHYTQGVLGTETFTFGEDGDGYAVKDVGFGCSDTIGGSQFGGTSGLVGLGRGALSLVSQLDAGRFAYCLATNPDAESPILFGSLAGLDESAGEVFSTPLVINARKADSPFYYVDLKGITVGESKLPIPDGTFDIDVEGHGGVIFDSGTTLTFLKDAAYSLVAQAFVSQMPASYTQVDAGSSGKLCFQGDPRTVAVPALLLHFDDGADMNLQWYNYFRSDPNVDGVVCLQMANSSSISIIGNTMQANFRVLHDVDSMTLSFQAAECAP